MQQGHVGVVGLGKMGSAFARRLLEKQYAVSVWDRSPQRGVPLSAAGAASYALLHELIHAVEIVIVMLWGDEVAREVTLEQIITAMQPSQILIEMSTLSPQMYETLECAAAQRNVDFVAAPVLGNPDAVRDGSLNVLAGGAEAPVKRAQSVLASIGTVITMPSVRASGYFKLSNNMVLGVVSETLGELLELCTRAGIDRELAARTLSGTFQRSAQQKLPQILAGDSEPRFSLNALLKDLHLGERAAASLQASIPVVQAVVPEAEHAVENGLGDRDYIVLAIQS